MSFVAAITVLLASVTFVTAYDISPPIPTLAQERGIRYPLSANVSGKVKIEAFLELNCPDSAAAFPVLQGVADHYGPENVEVIIHQLPLPYHRNAFVCTQGLFVIEDQMPDQVFDYIQYILRNWFLISGSATQFMIDSEVVDLLAQFAADATGIDVNVFKSELRKYGGITVQTWKYGVRRGVAGTPWYFINGNDSGISPSVRPTLNDWIRYLDQFFN